MQLLAAASVFVGVSVVPMDSERLLQKYLAHGVTTVRDLAGLDSVLTGRGSRHEQRPDRARDGRCRTRSSICPAIR